MSRIISLNDAMESFKENIAFAIDSDDDIALSEAWNNYTDSLRKDGELTGLQYHYAPAWGEDMPDNDGEFILDSIGLTMECKRIAERKTFTDTFKDCRHWEVTLKLGDKIMTLVYSMGSAYGGAEPDITDVVESILCDRFSADCEFSEWADNCGYSDDSIKAKAITQYGF